MVMAMVMAMLEKILFFFHSTLKQLLLYISSIELNNMKHLYFNKQKLQNHSSKKTKKKPYQIDNNTP